MDVLDEAAVLLELTGGEYGIARFNDACPHPYGLTSRHTSRRIAAVPDAVVQGLVDKGWVTALPQGARLATITREGEREVACRRFNLVRAEQIGQGAPDSDAARDAS